MPRLLVVEDHADIAEGLQAAFELEGHVVELARDGRHALYAVRQAPPDLVVLDLGLPGMDGFTLLERLRAEGLWCPVLILSARGTQADKLQGFRLGADDYVTKPFGMLELIARVAALLRRGAGAAAGAGTSSAPPAPARVAELTDEELAARFQLTPRQAEVARLLAEGLTNEEIGTALSVSRFTARNHVDEVMRKLGASTRGRVGAILRGALV
jgi:DNA-binding response OmpR family regulator